MLGAKTSGCDMMSGLNGSKSGVNSIFESMLGLSELSMN